MRTTAEIHIDPIGTGVSIRHAVQRAVQVLEEAGLQVRVHALGTEVEGALEHVLEAVALIHQELHAMGTPRLISGIRLETRTDKSVSLDEASSAIDEAPPPS